MRRMISQKIHLWLCLNMILLNVSFVVGHDKTGSRTVCTAAAAVILFFSLSRYTLKTVE